MNLQKRMRRERRHQTRQEKRRLEFLLALQVLLMHLDAKARGVNLDLLVEVGCLQALLLRIHEEHHVRVEGFFVRRFAHKTHVTLRELQALAAKARPHRPGHRPKPKPLGIQETERVRRRLRYRGGRKERAARRRLERHDPWSFAKIIGLTGGLVSAGLFGCLYGRRRIGSI